MERMDGTTRWKCPCKKSASFLVLWANYRLAWRQIAKVHVFLSRSSGAIIWTQARLFNEEANGAASPGRGARADTSWRPHPLDRPARGRGLSGFFRGLPGIAGEEGNDSGNGATQVLRPEDLVAGPENTLPRTRADANVESPESRVGTRLRPHHQPPRNRPRLHVARHTPHSRSSEGRVCASRVVARGSLDLGAAPRESPVRVLPVARERVSAGWVVVTFGARVRAPSLVKSATRAVLPGPASAAGQPSACAPRSIAKGSRGGSGVSRGPSRKTGLAVDR
jgi:hypothetical protein